MKNLRVCYDCHSTINCIAKITVLRDVSWFYHFESGACSYKWRFLLLVPFKALRIFYLFHKFGKKKKKISLEEIYIYISIYIWHQMVKKIASINIWSDHDKFCIKALLELIEKSKILQWIVLVYMLRHLLKCTLQENKIWWELLDDKVRDHEEGEHIYQDSSIFQMIIKH